MHIPGHQDIDQVLTCAVFQEDSRAHGGNDGRFEGQGVYVYDDCMYMMIVCI